ncbi:MAG: VOC family protein [Planctomycetia bacterium]
MCSSTDCPDAAKHPASLFENVYKTTETPIGALSPPTTNHQFITMKIEHLALNVPDPLNMARWYVAHLGMKVKRRGMETPFVHFLADDSGTIMLELYGNPDAPALDFPATQPPALHLAFLSRDLVADVRRLTAAGATIVADVHTLPTGDTFAMLRDPWGLPVQLVRRKAPMIE